jgi:uncharacterized protein
MTAALAAGVTGIALGAVLSRAGICLNSGVRRAAFSGDSAILQAFAVGVAVQLVLLPGLIALGVTPLEQNVEAGAPALLPVAQLIGGLTFGAGMALAGGCITGILWKTGAGSIATAVAIAGFVVGELLILGPFDGLISSLDSASRPGESALPGITGIPYAPLALGLGAAALALLWRRSRVGLGAGVGLGLVAGLAWIAADASGYGYGLGFTGGAEGTRAALASGGELPFQLFLAAGVVLGAALVIRGPIRMPDGARTARALAGGVAMGVGANLAHGCNIGHGVTGLALLSVGSLLALAAMIAGALLTWRYFLWPRPAVRGVERPEAGW